MYIVHRELSMIMPPLQFMAFADKVVTHYITWVWLGDSRYGLF